MSVEKRQQALKYLESFQNTAAFPYRCIMDRCRGKLVPKIVNDKLMLECECGYCQEMDWAIEELTKHA